MEVSRRSDPLGATSAVEAATEVPQARQNAAPGTSATPQATHPVGATLVPQAKQKRATSGSSCPHDEHLIGPGPR